MGLAIETPAGIKELPDILPGEPYQYIEGSKRHIYTGVLTDMDVGSEKDSIGCNFHLVKEEQLVNEENSLLKKIYNSVKLAKWRISTENTDENFFVVRKSQIERKYRWELQGQAMYHHNVHLSDELLDNVFGELENHVMAYLSQQGK